MIEIKDLYKKYGESSVLDGFSHQFRTSGINCLLGASGSGKSTLFNLLAGFDRDYSGEILVTGQDLATLSEMELSDYRKHGIGFVFQEYNLLPGYTVLENILLSAQLSCEDEQKNKALTLELLDRLGIREKAEEKAENLSGGQKQRVAIARALVGNPDILLADEPTGALDRNTANEIMTLFAEIAKDRPVLIITHDHKICDFADEVITIENGRCKVLKMAQNKEPNSMPSKSAVAVQPSMHKRAFGNFKVHFKRFFGESLAVTVAVCAVLMSFSSQNIIDDKIRAFEQKNTAFSWGQVALGDGITTESLISELEQSAQIEQYYMQYLIPESEISFENAEVTLPEKSFGSIAAESMNVGVMPRDGEIAITPSLAKQLAEDILTLIGKEVTFVCDSFSKKLTISGIFNGSFDNYYLDAKTEQALYAALQTAENPVSVAYKASGFYEVVEVEAQLLNAGYTSITASKQVANLNTAFEKLQTLFVVVSVFIVAISLFICMMILVKTARMRVKEMGLLMALGYQGGQIKKMLFYESMLLSSLSLLTTALAAFLAVAFSNIMFTQVIITPIEFVFGIGGTVLIVWSTTTLSNVQLLKTDPATVLRK